MVLLDLNLPEVHGFEVLKWSRAHPSHRDLPVVVFTSSARDEDRDQARVLGATEFMQKPGLPALFQEVAQKIYKSWLGRTVQASNFAEGHQRAPLSVQRAADLQIPNYKDTAC